MQPVSIRSYHALVEAVGEPHLYSNPWWLDATCGAGGWNALIYHDENRNPIAGFPFHCSRIRGLSAITTPPLTQWVSLVTRAEDAAQDPLFSLSELPRTSILDLSLKPDHRINIEDTAYVPALKYSFIIPPFMEMAEVRSKYNEGLRRNLKQAGQLHTLEVSDDLAGFLALCLKTYQARNMKPPSWLGDIVPGLYKVLQSKQCGTLTLAQAQGRLIAGILTAWDYHTTYYLAGGKVPGDQGTAAHALLLDHAIQEACARRTSFDFEGSMHPGIANFFQSFGAVPVSYWHFKKYRGIGRWWAALKS